MSQANPNGESSSAAETDSGIVITGGIDESEDEDSPESDVETEDEIETQAEAEAEVQPDADADIEAEDNEADEDPSPEEESETDPVDEADDSDVEEDDSGSTTESDNENASEEEADESEETETDGEVDAEAETTENDTSEASESAIEDDGEAEAAVDAEAAASDETSAASNSEDTAPQEQEASSMDGQTQSATDESTDTEATSTEDDDEVPIEEVNDPPERFQATVEKSSINELLNSISVLVEECKLRTSPEGIFVRAVDPANVGMVDASLEAEAFESFDAVKGLMGINLDRLEDVVGLADADDLITFEFDIKTRKLHIEAGGVEYTLATIDPDSIRQEPDLPDLGLPAEIVIEGRDIDRGVTAADMVSDHIALGVDANQRQFYVDAEGDTDDVHLELEEDELVELTAGDAHSLFSLDYLKDLNKAIDKTDEVTMELGDEFPIKMHFGIGDSDGQVTFMLAPRIQSD